MRFCGLFSAATYQMERGRRPGRQTLTTLRNYFWKAERRPNRVGTHEFVDLCRRVGVKAFCCVNFGSIMARSASSPHPKAIAQAMPGKPPTGGNIYANDPDNKERRQNGAAESFNLKVWQLGNETSYGGNRTFTMDQSIAATLDFAKAMRRRDPSLKLIGWGDRGAGNFLWATELLKRAGDQIDMVAMHMMGQSPKRTDTVLKGLLYQKDSERAWEELSEMTGRLEVRLTEMEAAIAAQSSKRPESPLPKAI